MKAYRYNSDDFVADFNVGDYGWVEYTIRPCTDPVDETEYYQVSYLDELLSYGDEDALQAGSMHLGFLNGECFDTHQEALDALQALADDAADIIERLENPANGDADIIAEYWQDAAWAVR